MEDADVSMTVNMDQDYNDNTSSTSFLTALIAGGIAGMSVDIALFPIDTIKVNKLVNERANDEGESSTVLMLTGFFSPSLLMSCTLRFEYKVLWDFVKPVAFRDFTRVWARQRLGRHRVRHSFFAPMNS